MIMVICNRNKFISVIFCVALIIGCCVLFSCNGNNETADDSDTSDMSYEIADSASAESAKDSTQTTENTTTENSSEKDSNTSGFQKNEFGGNNDSISWDDLTDKAKG